MGLNLLVKQIEAKYADCLDSSYFRAYKEIMRCFDLYMPDASPEDFEGVLSQTTIWSWRICDFVSIHKSTKVLENFDRDYLKNLAREVRDLQHIDGVDFEERGAHLTYLNLIKGLAYLGYIDRSRVSALESGHSNIKNEEFRRRRFMRSPQSPSS